MKDPKDLREMLDAQIRGEEITFTPKTNVEIAEGLLQEQVKYINENCYIEEWEGYHIPNEMSSKLRLLGLLVNVTKELEVLKGDGETNE